MPATRRPYLISVPASPVMEYTHLAKAKIMRLLVVMTLNVANARQTSGSLFG